MKKHEKQDEDVDDLIDSIIELPIKNIEKRIKEIDEEINIRNKILDISLSKLGTRELQLKGHLQRMKYSAGSDLNRRIMIENDLAKIKFGKVSERLSHFQDISKLKERLLHAQEQLELEKAKRKLVE